MGLLLTLLLVAPTAPTQAADLTLRVMTWNIHHGEGTDGQVDLERIAAVIKAEEVALVALQEVDKGVERTNRRDLAGELAALTGMTALFSNNFSYQGGEYGNAILSRLPVTSWNNTHLRMLRPGEQRGVLQATVDWHGIPLRFLSTHIDYRRDDAERLANVAEFQQLAARSATRYFMIAGDFNDFPDSRT
ncbi:MAG: endonuclease/exonuclease/phosphatase family protein, partial [Verrucomicrobiae bacterium]|nr:endonuclease/exonuclease/phosphatase family protein [Verrucomicrobiae bacterium]